MILVDTSVWVDFLRGADSPQRHRLHDLIEDEQQLATTGIVLTEVLQGIHRERDLAAVRERLLRLPVYHPRGVETWLHAAELFRTCRRRGATVRRTVDCVIAAICIEHELVLLHKDADFDRIASCSRLRVLAD